MKDLNRDVMYVKLQEQIPFVQVPKGIIFAKELKPTTRLVYIGLLDHNRQKTTCWVSQRRLAQELGMGVATIKRAIAELKQKRLLLAQQRGLNRSNRYILMLKIIPQAQKTGRKYQFDTSRSINLISLNNKTGNNNLIPNKIFNERPIKKYLPDTDIKRFAEIGAFKRRRDQFEKGREDFKRGFTPIKTADETFDEIRKKIPAVPAWASH